MSYTKLLRVSPPERNTLQFLNDDLNFMVLVNDMLQHLKQSIYAIIHHINTFTVIVDLSRSNFSIALFQLKSADLARNLYSSFSIYS